MRRIPLDELRARMERVLLGLGLAPERAALSARLTAETDRDGIRTHGLARLPRFAQQVRNGVVDAKAEPERTAAFGAIERLVGAMQQRLGGVGGAFGAGDSDGDGDAQLMRGAADPDRRGTDRLCA